MAGRGRGRATLTFNPESLGIGRGDVTSNLDPPPPLYPPLGMRPQKPLKSPEQDYMLAVMKEFVNHVKCSSFSLHAVNAKSEKQESKSVIVARYSDRLKEQVQKPLTGVDWSRFPKELAPSTARSPKKRSRASASKSVKPKLVKRNPDELLDKLEKKESAKGGANDDEEEGGDNENKENSDVEDEEEVRKEGDEIEDADEMDEELDEGTDYANNYFDNGENYIDDEDDNLDEGGIF